MRIDWAFQRNEDGSSQGWNDPSIAEFKANRLESLTRETIQNSIDANLGNGEPVYVEFVESSVRADQIPHIDTLREIISLCEKEKNLENADMIKELPVAKETANRARIPILTVSDYNTTGMKGPCEPGYPFYQYLKAVGQSAGGSDRAGSHGLGKAAPLACSDLRTIFISTVWNDKKQIRGLVQGRAVLMSFRRNGDIHKGTGYWGDAEAYQALEPSEVPDAYKWLLRTEVGTSVHVIGWSRLVQDNWEKLVIGYAISNFFAAFLRGSLTVTVNKYTVDANNVLKMAANQAIADAMRKHKNLDKLEDAAYYLRCLSSDKNVIREETQLIHLGRTSIRMMVLDDAPRKIALIRNNMLITDHISGFWKKIPGKYRDFVGVVEVLNPDGAKLIRLMEPPSHNDLNTDRLPTLEDRRKGELALEKLTDELKKFVDRHAGSGDDVFGKVNFMAEFFADEAGDDRGEIIGEEIDPNGNFIFSPKPIKLPPLSKVTLESEFEEELDAESSDAENESNEVAESLGAGGAGMVGGSSKAEESKGPGDGAGTGGTGSEPETDTQREEPSQPKTDTQRDKPSHPIQLRKVRIIRVSQTAARIFATPSGNAKSTLRIHEVGSDFDEPFEIVRSELGAVIKGGIELDLSDNVRMNFVVELSRPIVGGLKLVASHTDARHGESK